MFLFFFRWMNFEFFFRSGHASDHMADFCIFEKRIFHSIVSPPFVALFLGSFLIQWLALTVVRLGCSGCSTVSMFSTSKVTVWWMCKRRRKSWPRWRASTSRKKKLMKFMIPAGKRFCNFYSLFQSSWRAFSTLWCFFCAQVCEKVFSDIESDQVFATSFSTPGFDTPLAGAVSGNTAPAPPRLHRILASNMMIAPAIVHQPRGGGVLRTVAFNYLQSYTDGGSKLAQGTCYCHLFFLSNLSFKFSMIQVQADHLILYILNLIYAYKHISILACNEAFI